MPGKLVKKNDTNVVKPIGAKSAMDIAPPVAALNPTDAEVFFIMGDAYGFKGRGGLIKLGTIKAISYSVFRDKVAVRAFGAVSPRGYARGTRTIAGSIVFATIERSAFDMIEEAWSMAGTLNPDLYATSARAPRHRGSIERTRDRFPFGMLDQIPPFDLFIQFNTELSDTAHMILYGVELFSNGVAISIDNAAIEEVIRYQARAVEELMKDGKKKVVKGSNSLFNVHAGQTVNALYRGSSVGKTRLIRRMAKKVNPFF